MKKLFVSIAIFAVGMSGMAVMAHGPQMMTPPHMQNNMSSAPRPGSDMSMCYNAQGGFNSQLFQGIHLSANQQKKVRKLYERRYNEMRKGPGGMSQEQFDRQLAKILNPSQMNQYRRNRYAMQGVVGAPQPGPRPMILTR